VGRFCAKRSDGKAVAHLVYPCADFFLLQTEVVQTKGNFSGNAGAKQLIVRVLKDDADVAAQLQ